MIRRHVNRLVAGIELDLPSEGLHRLLEKAVGPVPLERGVSVGAGIGAKEMRLVERGVVQCFDLFELSNERIARGRRRAAQRGVAEQVRFRHGDAFSKLGDEAVDLVYWDMALHHMLDVDAAVRWSRDLLRPGGHFCMSDFVGPARFQWSQESLDLSHRIRSMLPRRYLRDPYRPTGYRPMRLRRPDPQRLAEEDPSEAADSDRILQSVETHFPGAEVKMTGGAVYHLALRDIIHNFDEEDETDRTLLSSLLLLDELAVSDPRIDDHYAVALAVR